MSMPGVDSSRSQSRKLAPPVGLRLLIVSRSLERGYMRSRVFDEIGYRVSVCPDPSEAPVQARDFLPDAIVIDIPRDNGTLHEVAWTLREATDGPLVVVGSRGDLPEMLRCLEAGADDVCSPGVSTAEIDLRLRALLRVMGRQANASQEEPRVVVAGDIEIDTAAQVVRKRGRTVQLSPTEFRLLLTLAENAGKVVPSKALIARVWGDQYAGETHYLRLYVRYLRQKLEDDPSRPEYIVNRWGAGYALEVPARAA